MRLRARLPPVANDLPGPFVRMPDPETRTTARKNSFAAPVHRETIYTGDEAQKGRSDMPESDGHPVPVRTNLPIPAGAASPVPADWTGAAQRGLAARREREQIIAQVLVEGEDFGTIPGTGDKPALLKSGAEKIADSLNLWPDYEELERVADRATGFYFYRYRCTLRQRGSDLPMASGIGSCNTWESKYRWRERKRTCPSCDQPAIIKGRDEYGGGWICWAKKGGCGSKFIDDSPGIVDQPTGQVENPDIHDCVNTVDKIAQKRSIVAASLNLGFSQRFTQDVEDGTVESRPAPEPKADPEPTVEIDDPVAERRRSMDETLLAIVGGDERAASRLLLAITKSDDFQGFSSSRGMTQDWQFDKASRRLAAHPAFRLWKKGCDNLDDPREGELFGPAQDDPSSFWGDDGDANVQT
jgi:hypothetical protein